ncbi:hypothetical protein OUZ56_001617 [Daphnia magna]|uniref:Uncharacterized protein n=1 Tax=Daphnia magna TaxID=35525 RepID=A0ABR0A376_9CRUS|nr:hypothetical protein OUZ56_001617 [Daphnia magna]
MEEADGRASLNGRQYQVADNEVVYSNGFHCYRSDSSDWKERGTIVYIMQLISIWSTATTIRCNDFLQLSSSFSERQQN